MENLTDIAKLLGAENEKRLKDEITDMILEHIQEEFDDFDDYIIDFDEILFELRDETRAIIKEKYKRMYMAKMDEKFAKLFAESFNN